MTENRPAPLEVTVHVAGRDGKIKGTPLPIANPGHLQEDSLVGERRSEVPDFDQAEHDKLFQKRMVNGVPHWTAPTQLTARQILASHRLEGDDQPRTTRSDIYVNKMTDIMMPKYGNVNSTQRQFLAQDAVVNATSKYGAGSGAGLDDNITKHGYDWTKPILLSTLGVDPNHAPPGTAGQPRVANGGHRLMWMFTHHPDVPIPVETDVHRHSMGLDVSNHVENITAMSDVANRNGRPEDITAMNMYEKQAEDKKASDWRDSMAKAYPEKYGSGKP